MKVLDIFSWLPAQEITLERLKQIFEQYYAGIYTEEYVVSIETPFNLKDVMLNCKVELIKEGKKVGYILKDDRLIAIIGYTE